MSGIAEQPGDLAAKQAIAELVHRYGQLVRRDCLELTADLYTPDGVFEVRQGAPDRDEYTVQSHEVGRDAIRAMLLPSKGKPHPVPLIHNLMIEVDPGGNTASGSCVMQSPVSGSGEPFWGEYRDSFAKVEGRWYFTQRVFTMFANP